MGKKRRAHLHARKLGAADADSARSIAPPAAPVESAVTKTAKRRAAKKRAAAKRAAERQQKPKAKKKRVEAAASSGGLVVVHEDAHVLAINKPAGLLCHPSPGFWESGTVVHELPRRQQLAGYSPIPDEMLAERLSRTGEADSAIPRAVVHRLDRGTTGVLLLAKTPAAEAHLARQFKLRTTRKRYVAVLRGRLRVRQGTRIVCDDGGGDGDGGSSGGGGGGCSVHIDAAIGKRGGEEGGRGAMCVDARGKAAQSTGSAAHTRT